VDLTTATPTEIDTAIYAALVKEADLERKARVAQAAVIRIDELKDDPYYSKRPGYSPERRAELVAEITVLEQQAADLRDAEITPRNAEHFRRGGWTRYYLVTNSNGHVHKDRSCERCFHDTQYAWLYEQSGLSAEELVELAGEKACTVCFPWAPVDTLKQKTRLEAPERKAARLEREAKKAAVAAKKAAKAITNPDGSPLQVFDCHIPERHVRVRGQIVVHEAHDRFETIETLHAARGWLTDAYESWRGGAKRLPENVHLVGKAVAAKEGKTYEQVIEEAKKRAAKRK
jgi:hypothetical protein